MGALLRILMVAGGALGIGAAAGWGAKKLQGETEEPEPDDQEEDDGLTARELADRVDSLREELLERLEGADLEEGMEARIEDVVAKATGPDSEILERLERIEAQLPNPEAEDDTTEEESESQDPEQGPESDQGEEEESNSTTGEDDGQR